MARTTGLGARSKARALTLRGDCWHERAVVGPGARGCGPAQVMLAAAALALMPENAGATGGADVSPLTYQFMVFVISIFVGYYVVWAVTPALHTPLMSVTNAI